MDQFICKQCHKHFDLNERAPRVYPKTNQIICLTCTQENPDFTNATPQFIASLNQELLKPDCHPDQSAVSIDKNFFVYCRYCSENHSQSTNFENRGARSLFENYLRNAIELNSYPREYLQDFINKTKKEVSATEILKTLKRKHLYDSEFPLCKNHLIPAKYLDDKSFEFTCDYCITDSSYSYPQYADYFKFKAFEVCSLANTSAFRSTIIKAFKFNNFNKNFFLEMADVVKDKATSLISSSRCLICEELFGLGERYPIQLHDEVKHEVCYNCFVNTRSKKCPFCNTDFPQIIKHVQVKFLYEFKKRICEKGHIQPDEIKRFSAADKYYPYKLMCEHIICKICYNEAYEAGFYNCIQCGYNTRKELITTSIHLIHQLEHLEILCEEHKNPLLYFNPQEFKGSCIKCKRNQVKERETDLYKFTINLIEKLRELSQNCN